MLFRSTLAHHVAERVPGLAAAGLESHPRDGSPIPVTAYDGQTFPFADDAFDAVLFADVLHHDTDPVGLLREAGRVAKSLVLVKDHSPRPSLRGRLALDHTRISLMDWLANKPYGIPCLYDYPTPAGWRDRFDAAGLELLDEQAAMQLYPRPHRWFFTPSLQYFAVTRPGG